MWLLSILITLAVLATLGLGLRFVENLESENRAVEAELHAVQMYDDALDARMKKMQRFRHDVNGLLQTIEYESMARSVNDGEGAGEAVQESQQRPNSLVDSLLELKRIQCESEGISFTSDVDAGWSTFAQGRAIADADVQAVVQNLLQNAYEASLGVFPETDRLITFYLGDRDGRLCIEVTNRIAFDEMPTFQTTKPDPEGHGIGLKVIEDIAKSYGGNKSVAFDSQVRLLTISVFL